MDNQSPGGVSPDMWTALREKLGWMTGVTGMGQSKPAAQPTAQEPIPPVSSPAPVMTSAQPDQYATMQQPQAVPMLASEALNQPPPQDQNNMRSIGMQNYLQGQEDLTKGLQQQKLSVGQMPRDLAKIEQQRSALMAEQAEKEADRAKALQASEDSNNQYLQQKQSEIDQALEEVRTAKVDPNRYWENQSTGQKIIGAIALALGGIGGGMTGRGGNMALDVMNNAINRDIEAQKAALESKKDVASMAQSSYARALQYTNDKRAAFQLAQTMDLQKARLQMDAMAGASNNAEVKARAAEAMAKIDQQIGQNRAALGEMLMKSPAFQQRQVDIGIIMSQVPEKLQERAISEYDKIKSNVAGHENALRVFDNAVSEKKSGYTGSGTQYNQRMDAYFAQMLPIIKPIFGVLSDSDKKQALDYMPQWMDNEKTLKIKREGLSNFLKANFQQSGLLERYGINPAKSVGGSYIGADELKTARPNK